MQPIQPVERILYWLGAELAGDILTALDAVLYRLDLPSADDVAAGFADDMIWHYSYPIMAGLLARYRSGAGIRDVPLEVRRTALLLCLNNRGLSGDEDVERLGDSLEQSVIVSEHDRLTFARAWIEPSLEKGVSNVPGLYRLVHDQTWRKVGATLAEEWLTRINKLCKRAEVSLVECLIRANAFEALESVATARDSVIFEDEDDLLMWLAIDVLVRFERTLPHLDGIGAERPEFIWCLRDIFQPERHGALIRLSAAQAAWAVTEFRRCWPYAILVGSGTGTKNDYDATDFLTAVINRIASDTGPEAAEAIRELSAAEPDSYTQFIQHMAAAQVQKRAEAEFSPLAPSDLARLLKDGSPANTDDLKALVLEELGVAQAKLIGDDIDQIRDFWTDAGVPRDENRCRDRLAAIIGPELDKYGVHRITEADMPKTKRADLAFAYGTLQIPMEVKGQWHSEVWRAAGDQLGRNYLIDWRSEGRGVYCVLWFGDVPSKTGRRLQQPPTGIKAPNSADDMHTTLTSQIPEERRSMIDLVVLDLSAGAPKS
ncbi:hypothetical protein B0G81_2314 [Paraburkholderia sp. BL6665CI2N2]|uniref:hypothetical protein n=1 Tax=Paraburkholderia sp. BL6665CI2N2 TaxID=1938806 RepID=UPI001065DBE8|nr:hypothetical protein [Paraburkholderia sp. BL6665CI2N2]TDY22044.1 hypothetical protein B0G81_2314 [Paraburkholderia sp. BL6665CI2N2]